jgi:Subtilase family
MFGLLRSRAARSRARHPRRPRRRTHLRLETLESRTLLTYNPLQLQQAYGLNQVVLYDAAGNAYPGDGSGQTIAIVDAYREPNIAADLAHFDSVYGLPDAPSFTEAFPQGTPSSDSNWGQEIALDVEYAHAMAPQANILLVEARSNTFNDLYGAVDYARNQPGVSVVSMSWASSEFFGESSYDSYFTTPDGHNGVAFFAASGDSGGAHDYPAMSPNVVSVGGSNLFVDSSGNYSRETAWSFTGGGVSSYASQPDYQANFQSTGRRTGPDVSIMSGPVNIYDTYPSGGFRSVSGTSVSSPLWAGIAAIADQQMNLLGYDTLDGRSQLLPALYGIANNAGNPYYDGVDFHDIQTGSSGPNQAGLGYDLATGLGTPIVNNLIPDLTNYAINAMQPSVSPVGPAAPAQASQGTPTGLAAHGPTTKASPAPVQGHTPASGKGTRALPNIDPGNNGLNQALVTATNNLGVSPAGGVASSTPASPRDDLTGALLSSATAAARSPLFPPTGLLLAKSEMDQAPGDGAVNPDDQDANANRKVPATPAQPAIAPRMKPVSENTPAKMPTASTTILRSEEVDACFLGDHLNGDTTNGAAGLASGFIDLGAAPDRLAGAAGLAVVLGAYWAPRRANAETTRRQRFRRLLRM